MVRCLSQGWHIVGAQEIVFFSCSHHTEGHFLYTVYRYSPEPWALVQGRCPPPSRLTAVAGGCYYTESPVSPQMSQCPPSCAGDMWTVPAVASAALWREPCAENLEIWVPVPGRLCMSYETTPPTPSDSLSDPLFLRVHI